MIKFSGKNCGGYTVIEMLISVAVLVTVTAVALIGRPAYKDTIIFTNFVYDVAQTIREVQVLATNTMETVTSRNAESADRNFAAGYGIRFDPATSNTSYITFADYRSNSNGNWIFSDLADQDDLMGTYQIGQGTTINSVCRVLKSTGACDGAGGATHIIFRAPDLGACINGPTSMSGVSTVGLCTAQSGFSSAIVTFRSSGGRTKSVQIYSTGQISVN